MHKLVLVSYGSIAVFLAGCGSAPGSIINPPVDAGGGATQDGPAVSPGPSSNGGFPPPSQCGGPNPPASCNDSGEASDADGGLQCPTGETLCGNLFCCLRGFVCTNNLDVFACMQRAQPDDAGNDGNFCATDTTPCGTTCCGKGFVCVNLVCQFPSEAGDECDCDEDDDHCHKDCNGEPACNHKCEVMHDDCKDRCKHDPCKGEKTCF